MAAVPRVLVIEDGESYDVLEVLDADDTLVLARLPFLFEVGEELRLRIEQDGKVREAVVRVRSYGSADRVTELEVMRLEPASTPSTP